MTAYMEKIDKKSEIPTLQLPKDETDFARVAEFLCSKGDPKRAAVIGEQLLTSLQSLLSIYFSPDTRRFITVTRIEDGTAYIVAGKRKMDSTYVSGLRKEAKVFLTAEAELRNKTARAARRTIQGEGITARPRSDGTNGGRGYLTPGSTGSPMRDEFDRR